MPTWIEDQLTWIRGRAEWSPDFTFVELASGKPRGFIIATFLAVLEMARNGLVGIFVERSALDFYLSTSGNPTGGEGATT